MATGSYMTPIYSRSQTTACLIPRDLRRAEAVARFRYITVHEFLGIYLYWLLTRPAHSMVLLEWRGTTCSNALDSINIPDDIVSWYWKARRQMAKKPSVGVG
ncbi:hypothetical protein TNCV_1773091 [Trichonephila clavipes]|nr:hypothetical protein TNCV_1773091 [Trichonephila clavipes]